MAEKDVPEKLNGEVLNPKSLRQKLEEGMRKHPEEPKSTILIGPESEPPDLFFLPSVEPDEPIEETNKIVSETEPPEFQSTLGLSPPPDIGPQPWQKSDLKD